MREKSAHPMCSKVAVDIIAVQCRCTDCATHIHLLHCMRSDHAPGLPRVDPKQDTLLVKIEIIAVNSIMHAAHTCTMGRQVG